MVIDPGTIAGIASMALKMLPELMKFTGYTTIKEFIEHLDGLQEKGMLPTAEECDKLCFTDPENIVNLNGPVDK